MRVVIITPTYNEAENINAFIDEVFAETKKIPHHEFYLFIVDGNSPDGTATLVKKVQARYKNLHLLVEEERKGLGGAYIQAIPYVSKKFSPEVVMEMDADFSHNPKDIKRLIAEIENGYDFVIGSRFVSGGSIPKDWGFHRRLLSIFGNALSRLLTGIRQVHDHTAGFRAIKVNGVLEKIDVAQFFKDKYISRSYAFQIKLLNEAVGVNARIKEVPVNFIDRTKGVSKMSPRNVFDSLVLVSAIRYEKSKNFFKVATVGGIGFIVQTIALLGLVESLGFDKVLSTAISAELAIVSNFLLNDFWTFRDRVKKAVGPLRFLQFNLTSVGSIVIQSLAMWLGLTLFGHGLYLIYFAVGVLIGLIWNYLFYSRVIWRQ